VRETPIPQLAPTDAPVYYGEPVRRAQRVPRAAGNLINAIGRGAAVAGAYQAYQKGTYMTSAPTRRSWFSEEQMGSNKRTQLATRKYVQRCMRNQLEKKEIDIVNVVGNSGVPTTSGRVDPCRTYSIIQGTTDDTRTGNFIKRTKLVMRWYINVVAGSFSDTFRAVLVHDKQTNGATPALTDILTTANTLSGFNGDYVIGYGGSRFRILRDSGPLTVNGFPYGAVGNFGGVINGRSWTWTVTKGLGTCQFDASAGAITDIVSGELFLVTISTGNTASMQCNYQLIYNDA